jgi:hypothetical protein
VFIDNHLSAALQVVTLSGINTFFSNGSDGLVVYSNSAITLNSVTASENSGYGAYLENDFTYVNTVSLTGVNNFLDNSNTGLTIYGSGNVSAAKVTANGNTSGGMFVKTPASVTLTCGNFTNNGTYGLEVQGGGAPLATLKLIGVFSSGQTNNIWTTSGTPWTGAISIVRNCP